MACATGHSGEHDWHGDDPCADPWTQQIGFGGCA